MSCMVQTWNRLPARRIRDVPSQLLPLFAYAQQQQAASQRETQLAGSDSEQESVLSACKRVAQGIKHTFALLWYFCRPSDAQRDRILAAGDQTRYISIAKLLLETSEHLSESFCLEDMEPLQGWCVDISIPNQQSLISKSTSNEEHTSDEETVGQQMNAAALREALLWAR